MKIKKIILATGLTASLMATAYAGSQINTHHAAYQPRLHAQHMAPIAVKVYAAENKNSKVLATVRSSQSLVPFFRSGHWVKVGIMKNGNVGWVNLHEMAKNMPKSTMQKYSQHAMSAHHKHSYQPYSQTRATTPHMGQGVHTPAHVTIRKSPDGRTVVKEITGIKNGVHYKIVETLHKQSTHYPQASYMQRQDHHFNQNLQRQLELVEQQVAQDMARHHQRVSA